MEIRFLLTKNISVKENKEITDNISVFLNHIINFVWFKKYILLSFYVL